MVYPPHSTFGGLSVQLEILKRCILSGLMISLFTTGLVRADLIRWSDFQGDLSPLEYSSATKTYQRPTTSNSLSFTLEHLGTTGGMFSYSDWVVERWPNLPNSLPIVSPQNETSANAANDVAFSCFGYFGEDGAFPLTLPTNGDFDRYKLTLQFQSPVINLRFDVNSINALIKSSGFNSQDVFTIRGYLNGNLVNNPQFVPRLPSSPAFTIAGDTLTGNFNHPLTSNPPDPGTHVTDTGTVNVFFTELMDRVEITLKNIASNPVPQNFQSGFVVGNGGIVQTWSMSVGDISFDTALLGATAVVTTLADSGTGSLRAAIQDAPLTANGTLITFAAGLNGGTISLTSPLTITKRILIDATALSSGLILNGKANQGAAGNFRLLNLTVGNFLTLRNLTLTNGGGNSLTSGGGAIDNQAGTLMIDRCILSANNGGSFQGGGAIRNKGNLSLTNTSILNNSAGFGGAIENWNSLTVDNSTFSGNSGSLGGAIYNYHGSLTVSKSTFSGNSARSGGGIHSLTSDTTVPTTSSTTLSQCTFSGNTASEGGGGGALLNERGLTTLSHCTVCGNSAPAGLGGAVLSTGRAGVQTIVRNSIIAGNSNGDITSGSGTFPNTFTSQGGNLIGTGNATAGFTPPGDAINHTPSTLLLAPLGNYGGPTQTMALLPGSPARDAAPLLVPALTSDARGFAIVGPPDIGAYEAGNLNNYNAWSYEILPASATVPQRAPSFDFDADGLSNNDEWIALTDPNNSNSRFAATVTGNLASLNIIFPTSLGRNYRLRQSDDLVTWLNTPNQPAVVGSASPRSFVVSDPGVVKRFYQVSVTVP